MGHCNTKKKQKRKRVKSNKRKRRRTQKGGSFLGRIGSIGSRFFPFFSSSKPKEEQQVSPQADTNTNNQAEANVKEIIDLIKNPDSNNPEIISKIISKIEQIKDSLTDVEIKNLKAEITKNSDLLGEIKKDSNADLAQKLGIDATTASGTGAESGTKSEESSASGTGAASETPAPAASGGKGSRKKKKKSRKKK